MNGTATTAAIRAELIEALRYPRTLIGAGLELEKCPHGGLYTEADPRCTACEAATECEWLYHNGEFAALAAKPLKNLVGALDFALLHVSALVSTAGHDAARCACSNCRWLRKASALLDRSAAVAGV